MRRGTVGEGEKGMGRKGGEVSIQPTRDQSGQGFAPRQRRDFQVSKGRVPRDKGRDFQATKADYQRIGVCTPIYISC